MAKGDLVLSLTGLDDLATELRSIKKRMDDTGRFDRELGQGEMGDSRALDALQSFVDGWKDGRKEINEGLDGVAKHAREIVDRFTQQDVKLKNALDKGKKG
ncbi:hypothetical protein ACH4TE_18910 [Streptomyces sioyaensis]|uniref:hypothetical protein n=1 Tax=Streptomyces sioyaensis TaxID=67364 RepID=UPI00378F5D46